MKNIYMKHIKIMELIQAYLLNSRRNWWGAEVLNKRDGRKAKDNVDFNDQLANELVDVIHYAFAISALNNIDLNNTIIGKDKKTSIKYNHKVNLIDFLNSK